MLLLLSSFFSFPFCILPSARRRQFLSLQCLPGCLYRPGGRAASATATASVVLIFPFFLLPLLLLLLGCTCTTSTHTTIAATTTPPTPASTSTTTTTSSGCGSGGCSGGSDGSVTTNLYYTQFFSVRQTARQYSSLHKYFAGQHNPELQNAIR